MKVDLEDQRGLKTWAKIMQQYQGVHLYKIGLVEAIYVLMAAY